MKKIFISYPGLSEELVLGKDLKCRQFFELVSSCGVFCRMPESMQVRLLQSIRESALPITGIIFVTDSSNGPKMRKMVPLAHDTVEVVTFEAISEINAYGLRVNRSEFTDRERFRSLVRDNPNHLVLVSTPYSCPDLWSLISDRDTLANRSSLFFFENKKVYAKWFRHEMNFAAEFRQGEFDLLLDFFSDKAADELFFLKALGEYTGGTTVLPLTREVLTVNEGVIRQLLDRGPHYLFRRIESLNIISSKGEHQGTQFRYFVNTAGEGVGFTMKFSSEAGVPEKRTSLKGLSKLFNSSGGTAISVLFEKKDGVVGPVQVAFTKKESTENPEEIATFLRGLKLGEFSLTNSEDLARIMELLRPKAEEIRDFFNVFFFEQSWPALYKSFFVAKTYFGESDHIRKKHL